MLTHFIEYIKPPIRQYILTFVKIMILYNSKYPLNDRIKELTKDKNTHLAKYILENNAEYDPRKLIGSGLNAIKNTIHEKNNLLGSKNQAF